MARFWLSTLVALPLMLASVASAQEFPGVSDDEIRIGNTTARTGPIAAYRVLGDTLFAFFAMINDQGGVHGRRIQFISYDDGGTPSVTYNRIRRLVEQDDVLLIFQSLGAEQNSAIRGYLNDAGVPQLFMATGTTLFDDPESYPWSMPWTVSYRAEALAYADYVVSNYPDAVVGVLYQNDPTGDELLEAFREGIGGRFPVIPQAYDSSDVQVDAQIASLQDAGVNVFLNAATPQIATRAIVRAAELGWEPFHMLANISASVSQTLAPAGLENAIGIVTASYVKDPAESPDDPDVLAFLDFMAAYLPEGDPYGLFERYAFGVAWTLVEVLRRAGNDLSRENVMQIATHLTELDVPMLRDGITVTTAPDDYAPIEQLQLTRFDGVSFVPFGELIDVSD